MKINKPYENYKQYIKVSQKIEVPKEIKKTNKNINVQILDTSKRLDESINLSKNEATSEKVDTIKRSILDGTYKVDDKTIAKKIMDNIHIQKGEQLK